MKNNNCTIKFDLWGSFHRTITATHPYTLNRVVGLIIEGGNDIEFGDDGVIWYRKDKREYVEIGRYQVVGREMEEELAEIVGSSVADWTEEKLERKLSKALIEEERLAAIAVSQPTPESYGDAKNAGFAVKRLEALLATEQGLTPQPVFNNGLVAPEDYIL